MSYDSRISAAFDKACHLPLNKKSKYVIFSDCHRGTGRVNDNFLKNEFIYLIHGHQADLLNSTFWPLSRFMVRYVWRPLESVGFSQPTSAAKNNTKKKKSEQRLATWAKEQQHILIAGHTHHPMVGTKESPYFNTGSCVSPAGITCIEIENKCITLVKWALGTKEDQTVYTEKSVLGEKICVDDYTS